MTAKTFLMLSFCFLYVTAGSFASKRPYTIVNANVNYFDAVLACKEFDKELVSIETADEWEELVEYLRDQGYDREDELFWTSGNCLNAPQSVNFFWMSDGSAVSKNPIFWRDGEPDPPDVYHDEPCVELGYNNGRFGLNDVNCYTTHAYICENPEHECVNRKCYLI